VWWARQSNRLTKLVRAEDRFAIPYSELRDAQVEALNESCQERKDRIKLLALRAKEGNISEIQSKEDVVQMLFSARRVQERRRAFGQ
jgi:hypothetical protein